MRTDPSTKAPLMNAPHCVTEPNILYFGTPVVLVSTLNEDGTANLAPISSAFWLGWRGVIGIAASSQTTRNLLRTGECVLNLPSSAQAHAVDRIARTTGTCPVPDGKRAKGYVYEPDKFGTAGHRSGIANRRAAACARMPGAYGSGRRGHARDR